MASARAGLADCVCSINRAWFAWTPRTKSVPSREVPEEVEAGTLGHIALRGDAHGDVGAAVIRLEQAPGQVHPAGSF